MAEKCVRCNDRGWFLQKPMTDKAVFLTCVCRDERIAELEGGLRERDRAIDSLARRIAGACHVCHIREGCDAVSKTDKVDLYDHQKCLARLRDNAMGGG